MAMIEKFSMTPLDRFDWRLPPHLPIELGHGLSVQNYVGSLPAIDHWDEYLSKDDIRQDLTMVRLPRTPLYGSAARRATGTSHLKGY